MQFLIEQIGRIGLKHIRPISPIFSCFLLFAATAFAQAPKPQGFEAFSLLRTRNIFDPMRQPGVVYDANPAPTAQPTTAADYAALTGILATPEKTVAFFSGSRTEYHGVLTVGSFIAGARITRIAAHAIEIEREGRRFVIGIGQTVPLDALSYPTNAPTVATAQFTPTASTPTASTPTASAPVSADRETTIRRMRERRQQQLQR